MNRAQVFAGTRPPVNRLRSCVIVGAFAATAAVAPSRAAQGAESIIGDLARRETIRTELRSQFDLGQQVLDRAVAAAGGEEAIRDLQNVAFKLDGVGANGLQGRTPEELFDPKPEGMLRIISRYDFQNDRYREETMQELAGGFLLHYGALYRPGLFYSLSYNEEEFWKLEGPAPAVNSGNVTDATSQFVPVLLLRKALEARRSVSWTGETSFEGETFDLLDFSWDATTRYRVLVSRRDGGIRFMQTLNPDPILGEDPWTYAYMGSQVSGKLKFPLRVLLRRRGSVAFDVALRDVQVNGEVRDAWFMVPPDLTEGPAPTQMVTTRIRNEVYEIGAVGGGWYRVQFIDRPEYAVVLDAMLSYAASKAIIREIRKTIGNKPIRYVVISHHHGDHTAGIRAFVEEGSTIVTSQANEALLRQMAQTRSRATGSTPVAPRFQFVSDRLALGGEADAPQVIKVPETPHVRDMQVLYDPRNRIVISGDLYSRLVTFNDTFLIFADWLRQTRLEADLLLGSHHKPISTREFLQAADAYRTLRENARKPGAAGH